MPPSRPVLIVLAFVVGTATASSATSWCNASTAVKTCTGRYDPFWACQRAGQKYLHPQPPLGVSESSFTLENTTLNGCATLPAAVKRSLRLLVLDHPKLSSISPGAFSPLAGFGFDITKLVIQVLVPPSLLSLTVGL